MLQQPSPTCSSSTARISPHNQPWGSVRLRHRGHADVHAAVARVAQPSRQRSDAGLAATANQPETAAVEAVEPASASLTSIVGVEALPAAAAPRTAPEPVSHPITEEEDLFASKELLSELKDANLFGKRGEALLFAQVAVMMLFLFPPFALKGLIDLVGTLAVTAGSVFIAYAVVSLGRNFSPLPQPRKKHSLVVSGMYSYVRHPMYSGLILAAAGLAALTRNETRLALAALLWWLLEQKVAAEESSLMERYPDEYPEYAQRVKKFLPYIY